MFSGLYSNASGLSTTTSFLDNWVLGPSDPFHSKANALLAFCFPNPSLLALGSNGAHGYEALKRILTADNLKHFLGLYKHYHVHWPMIHASFNPATAYNGLVLSMICVGAVYSDRIGVQEVRWLMELTRASVSRSSQVYQAVVQGTHYTPSDSRTSADIEEVQAMVHIHSLFVWHGSPRQRQQGRDEVWTLVSIAQYLGFLRPLSHGRHNFSTLHQPGPVLGSEVNIWTWSSWIEQEKRARVMYIIFLIDASLAIFFNMQPQFDAFSIKLPLPSDDAAWEAKTENECANALGLRGQAAQGKNNAGSRRPKQLGFAEALQYLYQGGEFPQRATNAFSKFILIHAIHSQIFKIERQLVNASSMPGFSSSGTNTPRSWTSTDGTTSNESSGQITPIEGITSHISHAHQMLRSTMTALELWKRQWDTDMQIQYASNEPRFGFCRDGIHYYFLANFFLRRSRREAWAAQPDVRCQQVFHLLKQIRAHVASDSAAKGIDPNQTSINDNYAVTDLTLDMKLLFTPISTPFEGTPSSLSSPINL
jgi:hypothetical protein